MNDYEKAMVEIVAAFSKGAQKGNKKTWTPEVAEKGRSWLVGKLKNSDKVWSNIRDVALQRAEKAGRYTATYRDADTRGDKSVIQVRHFCWALLDFKASCDDRRKFRGDDCPF